MKAFKGPAKQRGFIGIAAIAISAIGTASSIKAGMDAEDDQRAANRTQKKINRLRNKQKRRQFLRNFRQQQADAYSSSVSQGIDLESSSVQGARSTGRTQANVALGEMDQLDKLGATVANQRQSAATNIFKSQTAASVASFASQFISFEKKGSPTGE